MTPELQKKSLIALRAMHKNAKSIAEVDKVRYLCKMNSIKYYVLSDMADHTFDCAMEMNQVNYFLIEQ